MQTDSNFRKIFLKPDKTCRIQPPVTLELQAKQNLNLY